MSMPYRTLHALAAANKPDLPIKPSSTWVAILLHSVEDLDSIASEQDFLWIKCHQVCAWLLLPSQPTSI